MVDSALLSGLLDYCRLGVVVSESRIISRERLFVSVLHCSRGEVPLHLGNNTRYHHWGFRRAVGGIGRFPLIHCIPFTRTIYTPMKPVTSSRQQSFQYYLMIKWVLVVVLPL